MRRQGGEPRNSPGTPPLGTDDGRPAAVAGRQHHRATPLPVDLVRPLLGMDQGKSDDLGATIDASVHNGAAVRVVRDYTALRPANTDSTLDLLRLPPLQHGPDGRDSRPVAGTAGSAIDLQLTCPPRHGAGRSEPATAHEELAGGGNYPNGPTDYFRGGRSPTVPWLPSARSVRATTPPLSRRPRRLDRADRRVRRRPR
ncbi:SDR family oxidoreductase [Streptomyces parvus]|uniref:SDR family oxidoreductase n=1 Tax=Streptomyces parvus TaxID=66428 RepID=UPI00342FD682